MANEAGNGCASRSGQVGAYTLVSKSSPASTGGNVTKLEVYAESAASEACGFSFMTASGNDLTIVAGTEQNFANAIDASAQCFTFLAGVDFTAFAVSSGNFLACWTASVNSTKQHYAGSGGSDIWYLSGDHLDASGTTFSVGSSWLDGLSADISAAGGLSIPIAMYYQMHHNQ